MPGLWAKRLAFRQRGTPSGPFVAPTRAGWAPAASTRAAPVSDPQVQLTAPGATQGGDLLKSQVRDHWETETCGVRYGEGGDRLAWFREIARKRYELEPYIADFARFPDAAGKTVLEIGVGAGSDFLGWCRNAAHATGVDLTEAGIALTRERLQLERIPDDRYTLCAADAEALPFADASFDIVYSWGVLHHTPATENAYREVCRVLKPAGAMRTMVYHTPSWTAVMLYLMHGLAKGKPGLGLRQAVYQHLESPGTKVYSLEEARQLATTAGFLDVRVSTRLGPGDLLDIAASEKYRAWPFRVAWALWPRPLIRWLGDRFGLYLLIEGAAPPHAAGNPPAGSSTAS